jgi:hypothetical protein
MPAGIVSARNNPQDYDATFTSTASPVVITTFSNTTAGSILGMVFALASGATVTGVTDTAGNSWTFSQGATGGGWTTWSAYAKNTNAVSGNTFVSVAFTGGPSAIGSIETWGELIGGPSSGPVVTRASATGTSAAPSASLTSLTAGSAIMALTVNSGADDPSPGSGYTGTGTNNGTYGYGREYNLSSAAGSVAADFTDSISVTWNVMAVAFSPAGERPSQGFFGQRSPKRSPAAHQRAGATDGVPQGRVTIQW